MLYFLLLIDIKNGREQGAVFRHLKYALLHFQDFSPLVFLVRLIERAFHILLHRLQNIIVGNNQNKGTKGHTAIDNIFSQQTDNHEIHYVLNKTTNKSKKQVK